MIEDLLLQNVISFDLEYGRERLFCGEFAALMQFSTYELDYVVDSLVLAKEIKKLKKIFESRSILKVGCGISNDLAILQTQFAICPENTIDVQIWESAISGTRQLSGLDILAKKYVKELGKIDIITTYADFTYRPINRGVLKYAKSDAHLILRIFAGMKDRIEKVDVEKWLPEARDMLKKSRLVTHPSAEEIISDRKIQEGAKRRFRRIYNTLIRLGKKYLAHPHDVLKMMDVFYESLGAGEKLLKKLPDLLTKFVSFADRQTFLECFEEPLTGALVQDRNSKLLNGNKDSVRGQKGKRSYLDELGFDDEDLDVEEDSWMMSGGPMATSTPKQKPSSSAVRDSTVQEDELELFVNESESLEPMDLDAWRMRMELEEPAPETWEDCSMPVPVPTASAETPKETVEKQGLSASVADVEMSVGAVRVLSASPNSQNRDVCITCFVMRPDHNKSKCPYRFSEWRTEEVRVAIAKRKEIYRREMQDHYLSRMAKTARKNLKRIERQLSGGAGPKSGV